jgi:hypothetical protein
MMADPANTILDVNIYREWKTKTPTLAGDETVAVRVPWQMSAVMLEELDKSDPDGKTRVYCIGIGDTLAYRIVMNAEMAPVEDQRRIALLAAMMIGMDHGTEIRDAIERERSKPAAA